MDFDDDGYTDLIAGDRNGNIYFFRRRSNGTLRSGVRLQCAGKDIDPGANASPAMVDWDNDGDLDIIVGSDIATPVRVYINSGTSQAYRFNDYFPFKAGGSVVNLYRSQPAIYDMSGDGLFDVVIGYSSRMFYYYENTGSQGNPSFASGTTVKLDWYNQPCQTPNGDSRLDIVDWNQDTAPDFLAGDQGDSVYIFMGIPPVSLDEKFSELFSTVSIKVNTNPVTSTLSVSVDPGESSCVKFTIYSVDGRVVLEHTEEKLCHGMNSVLIPGSFENGAYTIYCSNGSQVFTERFVVLQ